MRNYQRLQRLTNGPTLLGIAKEMAIRSNRITCIWHETIQDVDRLEIEDEDIKPTWLRRFVGLGRRLGL